MMTDEQLAFIREIVACPDDLMPRLVYADWLEERGDSQGEFVRVQCELTRTPATAPQYAELHRRERELLQEHRAEWIASIGSGIRWYQPRHGFIEELIIDIETIVETNGQVLERAPILGLGTVVRTLDQARALASAPAFAFLRTLRLGGSNLGEQGLRVLLGVPQLPNLRSLSLSNCGIRTRGASQLTASRRLKQLTLLRLSQNLIGDAGAEAIARSPELPELTDLHLEECGITAAGVRSLIDSPHLQKVKTLRLSGLYENQTLRTAVQSRFGPNAW